jgi:alkylation response protein AidB-like acyl-CoA dehydrogenase
MTSSAARSETTASGMSEKDVLLAIDRLRPVLERHRDEAEGERRISEAALAALESEGFFKFWLPREQGGTELELVPYLMAVEEISRIDSAAGWIFANGATAAAQAALLPEPVAREVFQGSAFTAGSVMPRGKATQEPGGFRVSGRWPLVSGCHHADWIFVNTIVFDGDAPRISPEGMPDFRLACLPAAQQFLTALANVGLGIARAAIDSFVAVAKEKTPTLSQTPLGSRPTVHGEVARAEALYQSARAYLHEVARQMWDEVSAGTPISEETEARRRLACVNAAEACERVVDSMFRLAGTSAIYAGHPLDRCLRDIHTVNQHLAVSPVWWEKTGQFYFGQGLGMP